MKQNLLYCLFCVCLLTLPYPTFAEKFMFKFKEGEINKISSIVKEDVYFDGVFSHSSEIVNRIVCHVIQTKNTDEISRASAFYSCTFMTSEKADKESFIWGGEYPTLFWRNDLGNYSIEDRYFMPILRDVPSFPENDVKLGEYWDSDACEAYNFSEIFGIEKPIIVPFNILYRYSEIEHKEEKILHIIEAEYNKKYEIPLQFIKQHMKINKNNVWPIATSVQSKQRIAFDLDRGNINYYDEHFSIRIILNNGGTIDYIGTSHASLNEIIKTEEDKNNDDIKTNIENLQLKNTSIEKTNQGLKIIIENIQFEVNSAVLKDSEKDKLASIAEVLKKYGKGDILVEGHTVFSGTRERQKELSEKRAEVVATYLFELGVREKNHIFTRGMGGEFPIAPNTTEENKARNRRVEITIME